MNKEEIEKAIQSKSNKIFTCKINEIDPEVELKTMIHIDDAIQIASDLIEKERFAWHKLLNKEVELNCKKKQEIQTLNDELERVKGDTELRVWLTERQSIGDFEDAHDFIDKLVYKLDKLNYDLIQPTPPNQ
jgi:hypothetical protein